MSSHRFCTYFDSRYLPKGLAMYHSLRRQLGEVELWILCLDEEVRIQLAKKRLPGIRLLTLAELEAADPELAACKGERRLVEFYFTSTPCFTRHVMRAEPAVEWTTYLDADLFFFSSPEPIFKEMQAGDVGIIAHRFGEKQKHLEAYGIYNVGWVSFRNTEPGRRCLDWWRERCLEWCHDTPEDGKFADQKYLDHFSGITPTTVSIQHPGANLAPWNVGNYEVKAHDGRITVDGHELIFYHFHDCKQAGLRVFNPGLRKYGFKVTPVLRGQVYPPYLRRLLDLQSSTAKQSIRFDGVTSDETPVPEKDLIRVPPTRWEALSERVGAWFGARPPTA